MRANQNYLFTKALNPFNKIVGPRGPIVLLSLLLGFCFHLEAQTTLTSGMESTKNYGGSGCEDFVIGADVEYVRLKLRGADGGNTEISGGGCNVSKKGGSGAELEVIFKVDANATTLSPNGEIRIMPGEHGYGESRSNCTKYSYGGGGGSSGVLYKAPNSSDWQALVIAGAGGGSNCDGPRPQNRSNDGGGAQNSGSPGDGKGGDEKRTASTDVSGGGGGYTSNGGGGAESPFSTHYTTPRCGADGSQAGGGTTPRRGGNGFSGGGYARSGGGGGGGYSGGNGGNLRAAGGGGSSYIVSNTTYMHWTIQDAAGSTGGGSERNGYVTIEGTLLTWTGATSEDWNIADNWSPPILPTSQTPVLIPDVTTDPVIKNSYGPRTCRYMFIEAGGLLTIDAGGALEIPESDTSGIMCQGDIVNDGTLTVGSNTTRIEYAGIHLDETGTLTNNGLIEVDSAGYVGLYVNGPSSIFTNNVNGVFNAGKNARILANALSADTSGTIINHGAISVENGLYLGIILVDGAILENKSGASISLKHFTATQSQVLGISTDATMKNWGSIVVDDCQMGAFGIFDGAAFYNYSGGYLGLGISQSVFNGLYIANNPGKNNIFSNDGTVEVLKVRSTGGWANSGTFTNNGSMTFNKNLIINSDVTSQSNGPCGFIRVNGKAASGASFVNDGVIVVNRNGRHYLRGTNNGVISNLQNVYTGDIEGGNNGHIFKPKNGTCNIIGLASIGNSPTYTIDQNWYADAAQSQLAAEYFSEGNALEPLQNIPNIFLYVTITNGGNSCDTVIPVRVNLVDNIPPTIDDCPADITVDNDPGKCGAVVNFLPIATDNCNFVNSSQPAGLPSGSEFPVGTTLNTFLAEDGTGNTTVCSFNVTVNDVEAPVMTCPQNIVLTTDPGQCDAAYSYSLPTTDNCTGYIVYLIGGISSNNTFPKGVTTNSFRAEDGAGNTSTCSFTVTINDEEAPVADCPDNMTVSTDLGVCEAEVTFSVTSSDNCPNEFLRQDTGMPSGSIFPKGTTTNSYTVFDASGNSSTCSFTITVNDTEAPVANCPSDITVSNDQDACGAFVTYAVTLSDNCPNESLNQDDGQASGTTFPIGVTTNIFTATDASGNTGTCSFTVTVNDTQNPVVNCPAPISVSNDLGFCEAVVSFPMTTADNCGGEILSQTAGQAAGSSFPVGVTTNSFLVTDASGNTASCSFTVTVTDDENPQITCPANIVVSNDANSCNAVVSYTAPQGTDNCPGSVTDLDEGLGSSSAFSIGTATETYLVVDAHGNTNACSFTITVNDVDNPVFACPTSNVVRTTDLAMCDHLAVGQDLDPGVSDNCSIQSLTNDYNQSNSLDGAVFPKGKTLVTWTATDPSGNSTVCAYNIKINDKEAPIFDNCPADTTLTIPFAAGGSYHTWAALTASDNCNSLGQLTITGFPLSGSFFSVGTTPVNWTATDKKNNTSNCDFNVTVVEQGAPTPPGWTNGGVGNSNSCATNYDATSGTLTIITSGGNISGTTDDFCGITLPNSDQFIDFRARVTPPGTGYYDQAGIMMRQSLNGNAACASMYLTGTSIPVMGFRPSAGSMPLGTAATAVTTPYWVRLYRFGGVIQGYISADGVNWTLVKSYPNVLSSPLYLALFAKTSGTQGTATIDNISINGTAARMGLLAEETALDLQAYPNPFSEDLFIKVANALPGENYQVRLSNMMGQRVYGYETGASPEGTIDQRISLEHLAAGTYLLEVRAGVQRKTIKVRKF